MPPLIAICGNKRHGKDTISQFIGEYFNSKVLNKELNKIAFADPIKESVAEIFGITLEELELTKDERSELRRAMQVFGQRVKDVSGDDVWCKIAAQRYDHMKINVISDLRFKREELFLRNRFNTIVIRVRNPRIAKDVNSCHVSETSVEDVKYDHLIINDGTKEQLKERVFELLNTLELRL